MSSGSESEDTSSQNEYQHDDFVIPDDMVDEIEDISKSKRKQKKPIKRRRIKKIGEIDEEDLELVQENLGRSFDIRAKNRESLEKSLFAEDIPRKMRKIYESETESEMSIDLDAEEQPGHMSENLELAASIFGHVPESHIERESRPMIYEPHEIKEQYATSEAAIIKDIDIPERLQISLKNREHPSEHELSQETEWLLQKLLHKKSFENISEVKEKIGQFLIFYRVEKFEIPFIFRYRMHLLHPELESDQELWDLYSWDKEWGFLFSTKQSLTKILKTASQNAQFLSNGNILKQGDKVLVSQNGELPEHVGGLLSTHSTTEYLLEINDLEAFIKTYVYLFNSDFKTATFQNQIQEHRKNKLTDFTNKAGLTPEEFAENILAKQQINVPRLPELRPQDLAFDILSNVYTEEIQVINNACALMRAELCGFPIYRHFIREEYKKFVRIYTSPTDKGKTILDVFHPFYKVKNLAEGKALST